jgi:hypothetical protein
MYFLIYKIQRHARTMSVPSDKGTFSVEARKLTVSREAAITSDDARALTVGAHPLYPALAVDASAAGSATGIRIASAGAGGGAVISVVSSGTDEALVLSGKGISGVTVSGNLHVTGDLEVEGSGGGGGGIVAPVAISSGLQLTVAAHAGRLLTIANGSATAYGITLPDVASSAGASFRFAVESQLAATVTIGVYMTSGNTDTIYGVIHQPSSYPTSVPGRSAIVVAATQPPGSTITFECDGKKWYTVVNSTAQGGIMFPA